MLRNNKHTEFVNLLDKQDIAGVRRFITANPDLNYDCLQPYGMSALSILMCPPKDKGISSELLRLLLEARKHDRTSLIDPTQTFFNQWGGIDVEWILGLHENDLVAIERAIGRYQGPRQGQTNQPRSMAAMAANTQNIHDDLIEGICITNVHRLYAHYGVNNLQAYNQHAITQAKQEILAFIQHSRNEIPPRFNAHAYDMITRSLERCARQNGRFEYTPEDARAFELSNAELLAIVWRAAKESNTELLELGDETAEAMLTERKINVLRGLLHAQTAYGDDQASCVPGTRNQIAYALGGSHRLAHLVADQERKLTGQIADYYATGYFGRELVTIKAENPQLYWQILLDANGLAEDADTEAAEGYFEANRDRFRRALEISIETDYVEQNILSVIENAGIPVSGHNDSRIWSKLLPIIFRHGNPNAYRGYVEDVEQGYRDVSRLLLRTVNWQRLASEYQINAHDQAAAIQFLYYWLARNQDSEQITPNLTGFWSSEPPDAGVVAYRQRCMHRLIWARQKAGLIATHPQQTDWVQGLKPAEIESLLDELEARYGRAAILDLNGSFENLLMLALEMKYLRHLSLANREFRDLNLRGVDFSGTDLTGAKFVNCDWRGAKFDDSTKFDGVTFKNCITHGWNDWRHKKENIGGTTKEKMLLFAAARTGNLPLFMSLINRKGFDIRLLTRFYPTTTERVWCNPLDSAVKNGHINIVKAILNYQRNSRRFIDIDPSILVNLAGYESAQSRNCYRVILDHPRITREHVSVQDKDGTTALMQAVNARGLENFELLYHHPKLDLNCFTQIDSLGNNAFMLIFNRLGDPQSYEPYDAEDCYEMVRMMLDDDRFPEQMLKQKNSVGRTALMKAAAVCHRGALFSAMLSNKKTPMNCLQEVDDEGNNALMLAVKYAWHTRFGISDNVRLILNDNRMNMQLLQQRNNRGQTALDIASTCSFRAEELIRESMERHRNDAPLIEYTEEVKALYNRIAELKSYATELKKSGAHTKSKAANELAEDLDTRAREFFQGKTVAQFQNDRHQKAYQCFKDEILKKLDSAQNKKTAVLAKYRVKWSTILKNIGIAVTGIGALYIGGHLVVTKLRGHHARFPFSKRQTTGMSKVSGIKNAINHIKIPKK